MLRELTDNAWVTTSEYGTYEGLLFKTGSKFKLIKKDGAGEEEFADEPAVEKYLGGEQLFEKAGRRSAAAAVMGTVAGFPCNVANPIIEEDAGADSGLPAFRKNTKQVMVFAAGFYAYANRGRCMKAFCPKLETILNAETYKGPFATDIEQSAALAMLRKSVEAAA